MFGVEFLDELHITSITPAERWLRLLSLLSISNLERKGKEKKRWRWPTLMIYIDRLSENNQEQQSEATACTFGAFED